MTGVLGIPIEVIVVWVVISAILGGLINENKGRSVGDGVAIGAIFGLLGVLFLVLQTNLKDQRAPTYTSPPMTATQVYRGSTRESAEAAYHADARAAAATGYVPVSEHWSTVGRAALDGDVPVQPGGSAAGHGDPALGQVQRPHLDGLEVGCAGVRQQPEMVIQDAALGGLDGAEQRAVHPHRDLIAED